MSLDVAQRLVLRGQRLKDLQQYDVLQDVGMIAGMETVEIAQHGSFIYCQQRSARESA
jgi:hypothetical protein